MDADVANRETPNRQPTLPASDTSTTEDTESGQNTAKPAACTARTARNMPYVAQNGNSAEATANDAAPRIISRFVPILLVSGISTVRSTMASTMKNVPWKPAAAADAPMPITASGAREIMTLFTPYMKNEATHSKANDRVDPFPLCFPTSLPPPRRTTEKCTA